MFSSHKESIICPSCHRRFTANVIDLIEFSKDLDLLPKFLNGSIHKVKCNHCKNTLNLERPVLIIVDPESLMVWAVPPSLKDEFQDDKVKRLIESVGNYTPLLRESLDEFNLEISIGYNNAIKRIVDYVKKNRKRFPLEVLKILKIN